MNLSIARSSDLAIVLFVFFNNNFHTRHDGVARIIYNMPKMNKNKTNYDKKIFRLIYVLNKLDRGEMISTRALANEFNVSQRTVQRDIELLNLSGFPLVQLDDGRYGFQQGFSLKKATLNNEEASLLALMYEMAGSLGSKFETSFTTLLRKLVTHEEISPFYVKLPEGLKLDSHYPFLNALETAITTFRKITITYTAQDKTDRFLIAPLKIIRFDGFWYLLACPDGKKWLIKFRLENIKGVQLESAHFDPPQNLQVILDQSINIRFSEKRNIIVKLKIDHTIARYFKQRIYVPLQKIIKENKDGSLVVESHVSQFEEIKPVVYRWLPNMYVLSPKALQIDIKRDVDKYRRVL